jgi:signal transduction histidine kinase
MAVARQILPEALLSLLVGAVLAFFLARSQTRPLREIQSAVQEFTKGDLTRRVTLNCGGELEELGDAINRMAAELNRMEDSRRSFVANVSHELRSPLTSMRGYVQAMLDGTIPPEDSQKYLGVVMDETTRLTDLVRDLLDLSRLESGKFPLNVAPFDLNELIRRTLISFEGRIDQKRIEVEVELADDPLTVMGDTSRIAQVVTNIVDNAVKFMPDDGTGRLGITTAREGRGVRTVIRNNGPAIAENDLPYIFERFYKADKAHTSGGGTGLGLSICQRIMHQHGSEITVTSVPGDTAFAFVLEEGKNSEKMDNG